MAEAGVVTRALLSIAAGVGDEQMLARQVCQACVDGLDIGGASMSVLTTSPSRQMLWASDATADLLEELQFSLNEGACIQAATGGVPVLIPDLAHSAETASWPVFAAAVAEQTSVRAMFALPLQWGATNLGVLDLYRREPGGLAASQWRDALAAADLATLLLLGLYTDPARTSVDGVGPGTADDDEGRVLDWLDLVNGPRAQVHQAVGMVLAQLGIGPTAALARLRAHAFAGQRPLVDVARDVVNRRLVFTEDME